MKIERAAQAALMQAWLELPATQLHDQELRRRVIDLAKAELGG